MKSTQNTRGRYSEDTQTWTLDNEHLPATFIYAGIDVERCGVFTGTRGRQLAGRCELICTGAFPYRDEWAQLIAALEATLRLHRHEPGHAARPG